MPNKAESFQEFLERNAIYKPIPGEEMGNVYRKQHEAFIAYVNERVEAKMAEIDGSILIHNNGTSKA